MVEQMKWSKMLGAGYFHDRTIVVTGASSGIGRDIALSFSRMGAHVAMLARRKALLDELEGQIVSDGGKALALGVDVTHAPDVRAAVERTLESFGAIDILVNSAGVLIPDSVESMDPADLERMMAVNLYGTVYAMQAVLPSMRSRSKGNIVNIASLAGRRGMPPLGGYCATKFALVGLTEALRVELYGSGIAASLVMPGVIDTPMVRESNSNKALSPDNIVAMPPQWVTWAVLAAIVFDLAEVDVPPGAAVAQKLAALYPGWSDALIALGNNLMRWSDPRPSRQS
jgi:NAD(P)-dependent dehydrogenase (short-subunit alcohol dehydrogenase family)